MRQTLLRALSFLTLFLCFHSQILYADLLDDVNSTENFIRGDLESLSTINDCVNVVTGTFFQVDTDLVIDGPDPIAFTRSCDSSHLLLISYGMGVSSKFPLRIRDFREGKKYYHASVEMQEGAHLEFKGLRCKFENGSNEKAIKFSVDRKALELGLSNYSEYGISAHTNAMAIWMMYRCYDKKKENGLWGVYYPDGSQRHYRSTDSIKLEKSSSRSDERAAVLTRIDHSSGNQTHFEFIASWKDRILMPFKRAYQSDPSGRKIREIAYEKTDKYSYRMIGSNGQSVAYTLEPQWYLVKSIPGSRVWDNIPMLKEVSASHFPTTTYTTEIAVKKKDKTRFACISKVEKPEGRFLQIEYDSKGRVKELLAPIGKTSGPLTFYTFDYKSKGKEQLTTVTNALGAKTIYHIDKHKRIKSVETEVDGCRYCSKGFFWNKENGWLKGKAYHVFNPFVISFVDKAVKYRYDPNGNVIKETFFGNLTGTKDVYFAFDGDTATHNFESCSTYFTYYSHNNFNLKLSERDDFGLETLYRYKPSTNLPTNLLTKKLVKHHGNIVDRAFYTYDDNAVLIKTIEDNGLSEDVNNLTGVTERLITTITPVNDHLPSIGKPAEIRESYYDSDTRQERLLSCTKCFYSKHGFLTRRDVFDANMDYAHSETIEYDNRDLVVKTVDALGQVTRFEYDANHNKIYKEEVGSGKSTHYRHDYMNRLIEVKEIHSDGSVLITEHEYDWVGNRTATIDSFGNKTTYVYDSLSRLIETHYPRMKSAKGKTITPKQVKQYDGHHRVACETDERGFLTRTTYNAYDHPLTITHPDQSTERFSYFKNGRLKSKWDQEGVRTDYSYDPQGRVVEESLYDKEGNFIEKTTKTYRGKRLVEESDFAGNITRYSYDGAGRKIAAIRHSQEGERATHYSYDALGRLNKTVHMLENGLQRIKIQEYDALDRVIEKRVEDNLGNIFSRVAYAYDRNGNRSRTETYLSDAKTVIERTEYDSHNKPVLQVDQLGHQTTISYDYRHKNSLNQCVLKKTATDPMGGVQIEIFDAFGRLVSLQKKAAEGTLLSHHVIYYDESGNKRQHVEHVYEEGTHTRDYVMTRTYDSMGRLKTLAEQGKNRKITRYTYDKTGRKQTIEKPDGVVLTHTYYPTGLLKSITSSDGSVSYSYIYDGNHNPIEMADDLTGVKTLRRYNAFDELIEEKHSNGLSISYKYDSLDRVTKVMLLNEEPVDYIYDAANLVEIRYKDTYRETYKVFDLRGLPWERYVKGLHEPIRMEWDELGRREITDSQFWYEHLDIFDAKSNLLQLNYRDALGSVTESFTYDPLDQLTEEKGASPHTYSHDSIYNRLKKDEHSYEVNDLNQYESDGQAHYVYDPNGNLIEKADGKGRQRFTYDAFNRLTSVTIPDGVINYRYDADGRRLTKEAVKNGQTTTTHFLYQFDTEIGACNENKDLYQLRVLRNGEGTASTIAVEVDNELYTAISDHRGSIRCLVDMRRGHVAQTYRYSAFGEQSLSNDGSFENPWGFADKRRDGDTGHIHFLKRDYLPDLGRWLTTDPLDFADGPNLYAYAKNNPLINIDLFGLFAISLSSPHEIQFRQGPPPIFSKSAFADGAKRGFIDDSTWNLSGYVLGEYRYQNPSSQLGYYSGTAGSLFTGLFYGGTEAKIFKCLGRGFRKALGPMYRVARTGKGFYHAGRVAKLGRESTVIREIAESVKRVSSVVPKRGVANALKKPGRNRFVPDPFAEGAHSVFRRDPLTNLVTHYETYRLQTNPFDPKPWESVIRFDAVGKEHLNKVLREWIKTPHIHDPYCPGGIRPALLGEIPK